MFKLSLLLIIVSCVGFLHAQDYKNFYYELYQADQLYEQGNYSEALAGYEAASEKVSFVQTRILKKFRKAAKKGNNQTLQNKYQSLIDKQKTSTAEYAHLGAKIDSLFFEDQRVRTENSKLIRYYWKNVDNKSVMNSPKFLKSKAAREAWKRTDSLNILILLSMFDEYGFLDESKVGYDRFKSVESILLHFDRDTNNVVLQPIFDKALIDGHITPQWCALTLDRHLFACKVPQKYYAWPMLRSDPKLSEEEINQIIQLREDIGMYGTELVVSEKRGYWMVNNLNGTTN